VIRSLGYDAHERLTVGASDIVLATGDVFVTDSADQSAMDWPAMVEASAVVLGAWLRENC
jgi:adenosylhomocysteine nucleosidase